MKIDFLSSNNVEFFKRFLYCWIFFCIIHIFSSSLFTYSASSTKPSESRPVRSHYCFAKDGKICTKNVQHTKNNQPALKRYSCFNNSDVFCFSSWMFDLELLHRKSNLAINSRQAPKGIFINLWERTVPLHLRQHIISISFHILLFPTWPGRPQLAFLWFQL